MEQFLDKKNLLAFSAGVDSTALFFMLLARNIKFDIAIVDYGQRKQSKDEVTYAKKLAKLYNKKCFLKLFPSDLKFSEKIARDFRYKFFEKIIAENKYQTLLTAHQLNDKLEWFLMQMSKGAGLIELIGLEEIEKKQTFTIHRPLLNYTKKSLKKYLDDKDITYFIDQSNFDTKYKRNHFRKNYSDKFLDEFSNGVKKSFEYLKKDKKTILNEVNRYAKDGLTIFDWNGYDENIAIRLIDKELKHRGILISSATRDEILVQKEIIISDKIAISITPYQIWIAPKCDVKMDKKFKEKCRINNIPHNMRSYLSTIDYFLL